MAIVVDCSVAAGWALADERTEWTSASLKSVTADGAVVPSLFWFEIRNALILNERRSRINPAQTRQYLLDLKSLLTPRSKSGGVRRIGIGSLAAPDGLRRKLPGVG